FKLATGETIWEKEEAFKGTGEKNEDGQFMGSWSTPFVCKVDGKDQVLCAMPTRLVAYSPEDGKILWWCDGLRLKSGALAYSSPILVGDLVLAFCGYGGPSMGVKLGGKDDVTASNRVWRTKSSPQSIGSGVAVGGYVYHPFETGLWCI